MPNGVPFNTGFKDESGVDLGNQFVEKNYLIDVYPNLVPQQKASSLWGWGTGFLGILGNNSTVNQSSPVQTISGGTNWKQVSVGSNSAGGIKADGTLWLWGYNNIGQLGNNATAIGTGQSSPIQTIAGGTNWKSFSTRGSCTVAAIKTDGTLWVWGNNLNGQLGINSTVNQSSPVQTISGGTNWSQVSVGTSAVIGAIKTDGTLWMWGTGSSGILGNNATTARSSPVQTIAGGTNWKQVNIGNNIAGAIKNDGTLWIWGNNSQGNLGINSRVNQSSPVQTISGGTNWKQIGIESVSVAVKTDGTLWTWGGVNLGNTNCLLGLFNCSCVSSPVQTVAGGTRWKCVCIVGSVAAAAIKVDGTLWLWGNNFNGSLGNGIQNNVSYASPVQTISGGTNWKQFSLNGNSFLAIREEGDW